MIRLVVRYLEDLAPVQSCAKSLIFENCVSGNAQIKLLDIVFGDLEDRIYADKVDGAAAALC